MNNITDIILKLPAITGVCIDSARRNPQLYSIRDITYHLQMSYYWLKSAREEMKSLTQSIELTQEGEGEHKLVIPTLLGTPEQLEYLRKNLTELTEGTYIFFTDTPMPDGVKHKVEQSYNNMMLALFNTELSTMYYEQLTNPRQY